MLWSKMCARSPWRGLLTLFILSIDMIQGPTLTFLYLKARYLIHIKKKEGQSQWTDVFRLINKEQPREGVLETSAKFPASIRTWKMIAPAMFFLWWNFHSSCSIEHLLLATYDDVLYLECIVQQVWLIFDSSEGKWDDMKINDRNAVYFCQ